MRTPTKFQKQTVIVKAKGPHSYPHQIPLYARFNMSAGYFESSNDIKLPR